jgi:chromate transporter
MVVQFVGFLGAFRHPGNLPPLLAGTLGSLVTVWVTFLPCFFWIFLGAPYIEALRGNRALHAALSSITAAVVGVILSLALFFAWHVLWPEASPALPLSGRFDWPALLLAIASLLALWRYRVGVIPVIVAGALAGITITLLQ